jgi:hypothetical protein
MKISVICYDYSTKHGMRAQRRGPREAGTAMTAARPAAALGAVAAAKPLREYGLLRRWWQAGRSWLPLLVLSSALGLGLYWVATQAGWLAVGWQPAVATTLAYLAGVALVVWALSRLTGSFEALAQRGANRTDPGA